MFFICTEETTAPTVTLDPMQAVNSDSRVPEPVTGEGSLVLSEALEEFAQNMAENIIQSFQSKLDKMDPEVPRSNQDQEMLAEELASAVIETALREVSLAHICGSESSTLKTYHKKAEKLSFVDTSGEEEEEEDLLDADMDPVQRIQTPRDVQPYHPPLSQSGLPIAGSLDYPDAPPTTPLIPELERSRSSFTRKLKGGLAKVFLPSPPPPTPKDKEENSDGPMTDPQMELMEHLMHSLTTNDLARDGSPHGTTMEAFAEALSGEIMDWVLSVRNRDQITDESSIHRLAHQLAETIITSSLDKAKMLD
ncbi:uncharacterized protein [Leuresthes tenuis]|uniref:uncharacterized protein n=1 Tax=Leuresthes tenuis TaxID=355514 RepID=UPI003B512EFA